MMCLSNDMVVMMPLYNDSECSYTQQHDMCKATENGMAVLSRKGSKDSD